uniref:Putative non-ribosomal peptide synthetase n=1 Tax=Streptomyces sp. SANK 62799 TaxID=701528 RepID=E1CG53_9ACTN|nr:putative non-ribosomal peptide synthetase [Streptomyces sp. SANK 62799]
MPGPQNARDIDRDSDEEIEDILKELSSREEQQLLDILTQGGGCEQNEWLPTIAFQEEILEVARAHPHSRCAGIHQLFVLKGPVEPARLRAAWRNLQYRHDALRTIFSEQGSQWRQRVTRMTSELVIRGAAIDERTMRETVGRHRVEGFDLAGGALARAELVLGRENTHILVLSWHHSVVDGYSLGVLWDDLCQAYNDPGDAPLPTQQGEFAQQQSARRIVRAKEAALTIRSRYPKALDSPADTRPRPHHVDLGGIMLRWGIVESGRLAARAGEEGLTLYMVLLAAYRSALEGKGLLSPDAPVWSPMSGRVSSCFSRSVGLFMNLVPVFGSIARAPEGERSIAALREGCIEAFDRQDVPRNDLIELLPELPAASALFVLQNSSTGTRDLAGVQRSMPTPSGFPPAAPILEFDSPVAGLFPTAFSIEFMEDNSLAGVFEYDRARLDAATATEVTDCLSGMIGKVIAGTFRW